MHPSAAPVAKGDWPEAVSTPVETTISQADQLAPLAMACSSGTPQPRKAETRESTRP